MISTDDLIKNDALNVADQLERSFEGDAWHGPSVSDTLGDVSAEQAAARPIASAHSIWEIVLHMTSWQRVARERLQGQPTARLPEEEDWPTPADASDASWARAIRDLRTEYELLREEASAWRGMDLGVTPSGERYSAYEMLHGVVQHNLYHAGQIAILKKAAGEDRK